MKLNYKLSKTSKIITMKLNKFIFPAPTSSYSANQLLGEIIYVPRSLDYP
jgi:hypothetical protein